MAFPRVAATLGLRIRLFSSGFCLVGGFRKERIVTLGATDVSLFTLAEAALS